MSNQVEIIKSNSTLIERSKKLTSQKIRVAAYCRVSTDDEDQKYSYKSQIEYYTQYIEKDCQFVVIYADESISGALKKKK